MKLFDTPSLHVQQLDSVIDKYRDALDKCVAIGKVPSPFVVLGARIDPATGEEDDCCVTVDISQLLTEPETKGEIAKALRDFAKQIRATWSLVVVPGDAEVVAPDGTEIESTRQAIVFLTEVEAESVLSRVAFIELTGETGKVLSFGTVSCVSGVEAFRNLINAPTN